MSNQSRKRVLTLGGVLLVGRWIWLGLEKMDVLDGAGSLLAPLVPLLKDRWLDALSFVGLALIVYELGRSSSWWARLTRQNSTSEAFAEPPQPPPPAAPPEPLAAPESAERLLDLFKHWDEAFRYAAFVLEREICAYGISADGTEEEKAAKQLLSYAIRAFPLEISADKLRELRRKFEYFTPREATQSAFAALRERTLQTLRECNFLLIFWINKGGAVVRGKQLLSVPVYIGFCEAYGEALEAARLLRYHSELGGLAKALLDLETKPTPPTGPAPSTASG